MSQMPYCPNKLSPWARIQYVDENPEVNTFPQAGSESAEKRESSNSDPGLDKSWKRRLTNAGPKTLCQGRRTSFGSSQHYKGDEDTAHIKPLDREASGVEVERLLQLRRQKLKEAHRNGNGLEVHRLQNLGLFDDIDAADLEVARSEERSSNFTTDGSVAPPLLVTQGHTAELCWYMKMQEVKSVMIPTDFSSCTVHPTPKQPIGSSSLQKTNLNTASLSSLRSSTKRASTSSRGSTAQSSTWLDSDVSSLRSKTSTEPFPPCDRSSKILAHEDSDPFLYLGKYIHNHTKNANLSTIHRSNHDSRQENSAPCICPNHTCRNYLSGTPSQHCHNCKLPKPQPEIQTAISRIKAYRNSPSSAFDGDIALNQAISTSESLQEDLMLVEMYNAEMETRCRDGVWWEGWLVVEELKRKGIIGSRLEE